MEGIQPTTSLFCLRSVRTDGTLPATGSSVVLTDRRQDWVFRDKGKGKGKIAVPENCTIFLRDGKQLCKKFQVGACRAKGVKPGKRCSYGYHMCWKKGCHKTHPGKQCPGTGPSDKMDVNKYACSDLSCSPGGVTRHWLTFNTRNGYVICLDLRWGQTAEFEPFVGSLEWTSGEEVYHYLGLCYPLIWGWW